MIQKLYHEQTNTNSGSEWTIVPWCVFISNRDSVVTETVFCLHVIKYNMIDKSWNIAMIKTKNIVFVYLHHKTDTLYGSSVM